ncbi:MAG TPA: hypothetical protein PKK49_02540 [Flavobacteriales bacterium]|nr:hypothetical protein [Flavobacteriales bacterium]
MHPRTLLSACLVLAAAAAFAQPFPEGYARLVHERCPGADIVKVQRAAFDLIEVDYFCQGKKVELGIHNGQVVYEEHEGAPDAEVMERIRKKLDKQYAGWLLDETSLITAKDSTFIKVEVIMDGVEHNLYYTTDGKKYDPRGMMASGGWSAKDIAATLPAGAPYDLLTPDSSYILPPLLREVSGIAMAGPHSVYCVQDELGAVFEYDLDADAITRVLRFTDVGDFEGVATHGDRITVLRSDGRIFMLDRKSGALIGDRQLSVPSLNYEGLFALPDGSLLLASKEAPVVGKADLRPIHHVQGDSAFHYRELDVNAVASYLSQHWPSLIKTPARFSPSAVAIHPRTGQLYVLSADDRLLAIYGDALERVTPLPATDHYKPEGLAFLPNGDLLISSEGDKKGLVQASIVRFRWKGK